jgi:hypothetical protein
MDWYKIGVITLFTLFFIWAALDALKQNNKNE